MTLLIAHKNRPVISLSNNSLFLPAKELLLEILPSELSILLKTPCTNTTETSTKSKIIELQKKLPITQFAAPNQSLIVKVLSFADKNSEVAPFIHETLSKNLLLGKQLDVESSFFLNFSFSEADFLSFFLAEYTLKIESEKEKKTILNGLPYFLDQLKINLLSLHSARHLSKEPNTHLESKSAFSNFLYKRTSQKNLLQIKENLSRLMNRRFPVFDSQLFDTIKNLALLFNETFTSQRDPRYISKVIAFIYLFKKLYDSNSPERQIRCKLFKNIYEEEDKKKSVIGLLVALNVNHETERFETKHLMQAIKSCIPYLHAVKDSLIQENNSNNFKTVYLEIRKGDGTDFSQDEIKILKNCLSEEIKERVEKLLSPIFMPRNEEEILRNIILLSKQLKYVRDIPQMIITYDKQTEKELIFQVIVLRILKPGLSSIEQLFANTKTSLKFIPEEAKIIGSLKNKYPKEANLFKVSLIKTPFFRKDFSLDLQKARSGVVSDIVKIIGEFRDFNGGMIYKQSQALYKLKKELPELTSNEEFLLENFFFSLRPAIQQSIIDIDTLKAFFLLFLHVIERDLSEQKFLIKTLSMPKYILIMIGTEDGSLKKTLETAIKQLKLSSLDLTNCFYRKNKNHLMGYIYKTPDLAKHSLFYHVLLNTLSEWKKGN